MPSAVTDSSCEQLRTIFASKELKGFAPRLVVAPKIERVSVAPPAEPSNLVPGSDSTASYPTLPPTQASSMQTSLEYTSTSVPTQSSSYNTSTETAPPTQRPSQALIEQSAMGLFFDDCSAGNNPPTGQQLVILPKDDSYVSRREKRRNHGDEKDLLVDGSPGNTALLQFDLSCLELDSISSAVLRIYSTESSPNGGTFRVSAHDGEPAWKESRITWDNAPPNGSRSTQLKRVRTETWNEVDLTSAFEDIVGSFVTITIESRSTNR